MSADIDWAWVITNSTIMKYFKAHEALELSLTNKNIRDKLYSIIFNQMKINSDLLEIHSNYFNQKKYHQFENLSYLARIKLFGKHGFNKDLAFKEICIDPFIDTGKDTLRSASIHCKSLSLYFAIGYSNDMACYFLFPIFEKFYNLNKLSLSVCKIPFVEFSNLLSKLEKLEILNIDRTHLIPISRKDINLEMFLQFPKSLKELTYIGVFLGFSPSFKDRPLFILNELVHNYQMARLYLMPQSLPNLKILRFYDPNPDTERMRKFIALNPDVEYINEYMPFE